MELNKNCTQLLNIRYSRRQTFINTYSRLLNNYLQPFTNAYLDFRAAIPFKNTPSFRNAQLFLGLVGLANSKSKKETGGWSTSYGKSENKQEDDLPLLAKVKKKQGATYPFR